MLGDRFGPRTSVSRRLCLLHPYEGGVATEWICITHWEKPPMVDHAMVVDREFEPQTVEDQWLAAIPYALRSTVQQLLKTPSCGGRGLRAWLALIETGGRPLPGAVPDRLIEIYVDDHEAEPIHDCEDCGLPVPVRVGRHVGHEPVVEFVYFPTCPCCGGRTGRYAFWSRPSSPR